jgi:hypothetical protein
MRNIFKIYLLLLVSILLITVACTVDSGLRYTVSNTHNFDTRYASVTIPYVPKNFPANFIIKDQSNNEIPYQLDDLNADGVPDELFLQLSMPANSASTVSIVEVDKKPNYDLKTDITLKVRDQKDPENMQVSDDFESVQSYTEPYDFKQDNGLIFLEGPGWESNLIGYRIYFDDRNRIDIFGKRTQQLALSSINETYHERRAWGADILKVGSSLGIGTPALFKDDTFYTIEHTGTKKIEIITEGPLRSIFKITYPNWVVGDIKTDATLTFEIHANHRYTDLTLSTSLKNPTFATGLVTHSTPPNLVEKSTDNFVYGFTWGKQTDQNETLDMAVLMPKIYEPAYKGEIQQSYVFSLSGVDAAVSYRILAAWELEPEEVRINSAAEFQAYIEQVGKQWAMPLIIKKE